jgi:S1-C subfamily serine protease
MFVLGALAGLLLVAGCGGDDDEPEEPTTLTPQEVIEQATPAVVKLDGRTEGTFGEDARVGGTGILYSTDAGPRVLTNAHVVDGTTALSGELSDGQKYSANVVASAPCQDIAVVELANLPADAATLTLGESADLASADPVVSLGYPLTAQRGGSAGVTSTTGDVSNPDVVGNQISPDLPEYPQLIQHTATVNPGNSGGPLLDDTGNVVGINTLGTAGGEVEDQSYAIDIDHAKTLLPDLEAGNDQLNVGWNIVAGEGPRAQEELRGLSALYKSSVLVLGVAPGSPAEKADITPFDGILEINGSSVENVPQVCKILESAGPGDTLRVEEAYPNESFTDFTAFTADVKIPEEQSAPTTTTPTTGTTTTTGE